MPSKTRLIGLSGFAKSGKNTVGDMIPGAQLAFADPLKRFCKRVFDFSDAQVWGNEKEVMDTRYPRPDGSYLTAREAMQTLGTEWGRKCYPNIWAEYGVREALAILKELEKESAKGFAIITDVRFINEAKAIRAVGGEVWQIHRAGVGPLNDHPSEMEQTTQEFLYNVDVHVRNDGTLDELRSKVDFLTGSWSAR